MEVTDSRQLEPYIALYKGNLLNSVLPFWERYSLDEEYGGFFTCLDKEGHVYDTDKFMWLQCRQIWTFSMLYNKLERREQWLEIAKSGAEFIKKYGRDEHGNWYFSLTRGGQPITQPFNIFSDCFAAMAFAQLYEATQDEAYATLAKDTFYNILNRQADPKGKYNKLFPGTRPLQGFALPMILCNLTLEMQRILPKAVVEATIDNGIKAVMETFYQPELGVILENVGPGGAFSDSFEGRLLNPGHAIEAMWFIMDLAERSGDSALLQKAVDITIDTLELGWDKQHGGIFYFLDVKGYAPQQLEWDQKLWWPHVEAIISLLKGYLHTQDERCWKWFEKLHNYTWDHFVDAENGEWFGYLNRQGDVLLPIKGGKWKGCFHVPRGLFQAYRTLERIHEKTNQVAPI